MPTVLWTCGTLKSVTNSRGKAGVPLLSLKMSVLRLFLPVYRLKAHCRSKRFESDMHVVVRDIMQTALWTCGTLERVTLSLGKAGIPLLNLKMSVLRLFLPVCRQMVNDGKRKLIVNST